MHILDTYVLLTSLPIHRVSVKATLIPEDVRKKDNIQIKQGEVIAIEQEDTLSDDVVPPSTLQRSTSLDHRTDSFIPFSDNIILFCLLFIGFSYLRKLVVYYVLLTYVGMKIL